MTAAESMTALFNEKSKSLFATSPDDVQRAARECSTAKGFSMLAHDFFTRWTHRFLTYHLSRELSTHVGPTQRFADISVHQQFVEQLHFSCHQSATIVRTFAGDWFGKTEYQGGISPKKAGNFAWAAQKKIRDELSARGGPDA